MITLDLVEYIETQIKKNISKELIISRLLSAGWHQEDIDEGFKKVIIPVAPFNSVIPVVLEEEKLHTEPIQEIQKPIEEKKEETITDDIVVAPLEINSSKVWTPISFKPKVEEIKPEVNAEIKLPEIVTEPEEVKISINKVEEIAPKIENPKPTLVSTLNISSNFTKLEKPIEKPVEGVVRNAMLSSFASDVSFIKEKETPAPIESKVKKPKTMKILLIIILILLIGGAAFAFWSGSLSLSSLGISFVKKDPKELLLNASIVADSIKSYKSNTTIKITSPSLASITSGLVSGEEVETNNTDYIEAKINGFVNKKDKTSLSFDYNTLIKSSLMAENLNLDLKYNGSNYYLSVPDLSGILGKNAPIESTVYILGGQFNLFASLLPVSIQDKIKELDIYQILSAGVPSNLEIEAIDVFNNFIKNVTIAEKGNEDIQGIYTYHYELISDRQNTKKSLVDFVNVFIAPLAEEENLLLEDKIGAISIDSMEVWVGKDHNIHQYRIVASVPLSKVVGLADKSIGDNKVTLELKTILSDFDISNTIASPEDSIKIDDFLKNIEDIRIKNNISSLSVSALDLFKIEGSYGKNVNTSGSCVEPVSGSLFSPIGHIKKASDVVSSVASAMKNILKDTDNLGYCYSSPKAWATAFPLKSGTDSLFCVDSIGNSLKINSDPGGLTCDPGSPQN